jgi:multidrug efflux pump subunit AcrA (membrane-fusion protein)
VFADTEPDPVPLYTAQKSSYTVTIPADGEIIGHDSALIRAPRTGSGALTLGWLAPEGSSIKIGDPVVQFDNTEARLSLETQQNALTPNEQRIAIAEANHHLKEGTTALDLADAVLEYQHLKALIPEDETIFSKWDIIEATVDTQSPVPPMRRGRHR